jgi:acyl dehydratase
MANLKPGGEKAALCLEDLRVGQRFLSGTHRIDEEQIRAFAEQFDPQPFHLDAEAAATSRERNCSWTAASHRCKPWIAQGTASRVVPLGGHCRGLLFVSIEMHTG